MSQAEHQRDPEMEDGGNPSSETFTLNVVSPSAGVRGPLTFPQLQSQTTVKQLKERIRESLPMRPSDNKQRLIYRGRLLSGEDETMLAIFGAETIKTSDSQTLHLVLTPSISENAPAQDTARSQQQAPATLPQRLPQNFVLPPVPQLPESIQQLAVEARERAVNSPTTTGQVRVPTPPHFPTLPPPVGRLDEQAGPDHQGHPHHHHPQIAQTMQAMQQIQQDHARLHQQHLFPGMPGALPHQNPVPNALGVHSFQRIIAQHQQGRAALGMHGVPNQGPHQGTNVAPNAGGASQPQSPSSQDLHRPPHILTHTHEVNTPDGQRWTVTVNESSSYSFNPSGLPLPPRTSPDAAMSRDAEDVLQNIVRAMENNANVQRNPPHQQGLDFSSNSDLSVNSSGAADRPASAPPIGSSSTPSAIDNVHAASEHIVPTTNSSSNTSTSSGPMVYILSSPTGPRGLLVSPSEDGLEAFYTPRRPVPWNYARQTQQPPQNPMQPQHNPALGLPEVRNRREGRHNHLHHHGHRHGEAAARHAPGIAQPGNPQAGDAAAQMWPHVWLVVRLLGFVWFFTSGSNSWWRLFMFSAVALIIFIASTGVLNGAVEQVWGPVRRHLENLLPLAAPHPPAVLPPIQVGGVAVNAQEQAGGLAGEVPAPAGAQLDPAQTAARLLEQRRLANENWFWTQFRRLEHATILFIASLVPGVGERHIAARVAEENLLLEVQRQRREAEAAAAEEAARATGGPQERGGAAPTTGTDTDTTGVNTPTTGTEEGGSASGQRRNENLTLGGSSGSGDAAAST